MRIGTISVEGKRRALREIFGGRVWLGIASRVEDGALIEIKDDHYSRQKIEFEDLPEGMDGEVSLRSRERISFGPLAADYPGSMRYWFVSDRRSGPGSILASGEVEPEWFDPETGEIYSAQEHAAHGEYLPGPHAAKFARCKELWPRLRAGVEPIFPAGSVVVTIGD